MKKCRKKQKNLFKTCLYKKNVYKLKKIGAELLRGYVSNYFLIVLLIQERGLKIMSKFKLSYVFVCSALLLSACSYMSKPMTESQHSGMMGDKPVMQKEVKEIKSRPIYADRMENLPTISVDRNQVSEAGNSGFYISEPVISGKITGDYGNGGVVRSKIRGIIKDYELLVNDVAEIESQIKQSNSKISSDTSDYVSLVAGMTVRLQAGTTPGNPRLVGQWDQAQRELEDLSKELINLNSLANDIDNDASLAAFIGNAIEATYGISGAVEEEHEELKRIEDELSYLVNRIGRLVTQANDDIARQTKYLEEERKNMQTIALAVKRGEFFGNSLMNRTLETKDSYEASKAAYEMKNLALDAKFPIITIRFAEDNVDYTSMLYKAIDGAVDLKANANFRVVAVSPETESMMTSEASKDYAKKKGERIFRDMVSMGVPAKNITLETVSSEDVKTTEVQVFLK